MSWELAVRVGIRIKAKALSTHNPFLVSNLILNKNTAGYCISLLVSRNIHI